MLYGVVWFGAYNIALNAAERDLDAGTTALIVNVGPIFAAVIAGFIYKEGFPKPLMIGMGIAFAGVVLIALSTKSDSTAVDTASTTGVLLCVAAAAFYAFGTLAQKPALKHMQPVMSVWLGCLVGIVVCLPFAPTLIDELGGASAEDIGGSSTSGSSRRRSASARGPTRSSGSRPARPPRRPTSCRPSRR